MASDQNHDIVNKTKKLLKEYGYEVKTTHLYEVFAKLANEASWNVAKAKSTNFTNVLKSKPSLIPLNRLFIQSKSNTNVIISAFHERLGHSIEDLDDGDALGLSHIITIKTKVKNQSQDIECVEFEIKEDPEDNPIRLAVMNKIEFSSEAERNSKEGNFINISAKHIKYLVQGMSAYKCTRGIIYTTSTNIPQSLYTLAAENYIEIVDYEDLKRIFLRNDKEMFSNITLYQDVLFSKQFWNFKILSQFLSEFNFKIVIQDNAALIAQFIASRDESKYAIFLFNKDTAKEDKILLTKLFPILKVDGIISITNDFDINSEFKNLNIPSNIHNIEITAHDLQFMARGFDNRDMMGEDDFNEMYKLFH